MKKIILLLIICMSLSKVLIAQEVVFGVITDTDGKPLVNVSVQVKGGNEKTISLENGSYSIVIPEGHQTLLFSYEAYPVREIEVKSSKIDIVLSKDKNVNVFDLSFEELMNVKVVTASKNEQSVNQAPATIVVVTASQIEMRRYRSLLEVLQDMPGFMVKDFVHSQYRNKISMRGFDDQTKFIILLDGVRISPTTGEITTIMENYPVNFAKQIEIVYGPASALYGADAIAGVINIISKDLPSDKKFTTEFSPAAGMYGLYNGTLNGGVRFNQDASFYFSDQYYSEQFAPLQDVVQDKTRFNFQAQQTGSFNTIFGPITPVSPYSKAYEYPSSAYNVYAALKLKNFDLGVFSNMSQNSTSFPTTGDNAIYNSDAFFRAISTAVNASYKFQIGSFNLTSKLSGNSYKVDPASSYRNAFDNLEHGYKYDLGSTWEVEQQVSWQPNPKLNIIGGVNYEMLNAIPQTTDLDRPVNESGDITGIILGTRLPNNPDGIPDDIHHLVYFNMGVYLQTQYAFSNKVSVTLGARYDYNTHYGSTFNPRAGLVVTPTSKTTIKALYGSAFLAPSPFETYQHYGSFYSTDNGTTYKSYYWFLPNPDLKPIFMKTAELSLRQFIGSKLNFTATGFYTWVNNLFNDLQPDTKNLYNGMYRGWPVAYINMTTNEGNQQIYGLTLEMSYSYSNDVLTLRPFASISYANSIAETDYTDASKVTREKYAESASLIPLISHIGVDITLRRFSVSPRLSIVGEQRGLDFQNPSDPYKRITIPGFNLLNLTLNYQFAKSFTAYCIVYNALNSRYTVTNDGVVNTPNSIMYGSPQQPIHAAGGFKLNF